MCNKRLNGWNAKHLRKSLPGMTRQSILFARALSLMDHRVTARRAGPVMTPAINMQGN